IGRRYAGMLRENGIETALDLCHQPQGWVRQRMGMVGLRTVLELKGRPCIGLETQPPDKKTTTVSRSFPAPLTRLEDLREAVASFAARAAEKLRQGNLITAGVTVFIHTSRFRTHDAQHHDAVTVALPCPTNHTTAITRAALAGVERMFRPGCRYKKAGVLLLDLVRTEGAQPDLFWSGGSEKDPDRCLMNVVDSLNRKLGRGAVFYGSAGIRPGWHQDGRQDWRMRQAHRSPRFTTNWNELPQVRG
ncbi:MAG: DUF4113 domain-containing protein, partial [Rhodospirillales bacterium]|nr:DUF4113 domain-containing protein [Rhodospirillales bacterium]